MSNHSDADAERRAHLIAELAKVMYDRDDINLLCSFEQIAAAVVEYLEKHGLLKPGD